MGPFDGGRLDTSAVSGQDLYLTLDMDLQGYAEKLLQGKTGSIVAIDPKTGEILCLASAPSYDPHLLALNRNRGEAFRRLAYDTLHPFFNRAISANYPAGSLMKPIYSLAAQHMNVVDPDAYFRCQGAYYYRSASWGCHAGPGVHNMRDAIQVSCNSYFYDLYRKMVDKHGAAQPERGLNELNSILREMGLGQPLGIDLEGESAGFLPSPNYYDQMYSFQQADWRSTYIISNGIGQGELQLTPLQMANLAALLANRGFFYTPHLVRAKKMKSGQIQELTFPVRQTALDSAYFPVVLEGMQRAVDYGTARGARVPGIDICGKTGTSQNPHGKDHSVFFAFAPRENPQIALAVFVENGGFGGTYAAPMGGLLIEKYLQDSIAPNRQWWEDRMMQALLTANL
jgi:penicillin-binding protein 2